jgi:hypothetical protein
MSMSCGHKLAYCSSPTWYMSMESHGGMILTEDNRITRKETCPNATFPPQMPLDWLGLKLGPFAVRGGRLSEPWYGQCGAYFILYILPSNKSVFLNNIFISVNSLWTTKSVPCVRNVSVKKYSTPTTHLWRHRAERMYSCYSFTILALDGGEWSASLPGRVLPPGKVPRYILDRRLGGP